MPKQTRDTRWVGAHGKLHAVLSAAFPKRRTEEHNFFDVPWLADKLGLSREGVYKWLRSDQIPVQQVRKILQIKGCKAKFADFTDFLK